MGLVWDILTLTYFAGRIEMVSSRETQMSPLLQLTSFVSSSPTSIVCGDGENKGLEGERHFRDGVIAIPPSPDTSTTPSMEPSRTYSTSNTPQISRPVAEGHSGFEEPKPARVPIPELVPPLPPQDATTGSSPNESQVESGASFPRVFLSH